MVAVNSTMLPLGTVAPDFHLPDTHGKTVSLADFKGAPVLVVNAGLLVWLALRTALAG